MEYRICNLTGTYISLRVLVWFSFFKLVNEPLLNEMNLVNEELMLKKKNKSTLLDFNMNMLLFSTHSPSFPLSIFKRSRACLPSGNAKGTFRCRMVSYYSH